MSALSEQLDLLEQQGAFTYQQPQPQPQAQPQPQPPAQPEGPSALSLALDKAEAEDAAQREWEAKQDEGSVVEKYGGQVLRGMFRGGEKLMTGAADLVGFDEFADNYESKAGRSSGTALERMSEYATPVPGLGAATGAVGTLVGKAVPALPKVAGALGKTMGHAGAQGAAYGALLSDADDTVGKVKDAALGAVSGATTGGLLHGAGRGVATVSKEAKNLTKTLDNALGEGRIGGALTLGKQVGDSPDLPSKLVGALAKQANRGKRAVIARDKDQRVSDDIAQVAMADAFKGIPGALPQAQKKLRATRDYKKAFKAGNKIARQHEGGTTNAESRELLWDTVKKAKTRSGRYSPDNAYSAGHEELAKLMQPMRHQGFVPKLEKSKAAGSAGAAVREVGALAAPAVLGHPEVSMGLIAADVVGRAVKGVVNWRRGRHAKILKKAPFKANVKDLAPLPDEPILAKILTGNTGAQQKYQALARAGDTEALESYLTQLIVRAETEDAP